MNIELNETEPKYKTVIGHYPSQKNQKNRIHISKTAADGCCNEGGDHGGCTLIRRTSFTSAAVGVESTSPGRRRQPGEDTLKPPRNPDSPEVVVVSSNSSTMSNRARSSASLKQTGSRTASTRNTYVMQSVVKNDQIDEGEVKFTLYPQTTTATVYKPLSASNSDTSSTFSSSTESTSSSSSSATSTASSSESSTNTSCSSSQSSSVTTSSTESRSSMV